MSRLHRDQAQRPRANSSSRLNSRSSAKRPCYMSSVCNTGHFQVTYSARTRRGRPPGPPSRWRAFRSPAPASLSKREHIDHGARIGIFQRRWSGRSLPFGAGCNSNILLAVDRVADRRRDDAATGVEPPQLFQGPAVVGYKRALPQPAEDQIAASREHARPVRQVGARHRLGFAAHGIKRLDAAGGLLQRLAGAAGEPFARLYGAALIGEIGLHLALKLIATFARRDVDQVQFGIKGRGLPVLAAWRRRTPRRNRIGARGVAPLHIGLHVLGGIVVERPAGLGVDTLGPGQLIDILFAGDEGTVDAIERVIEAVARPVHHQLAILAVDLGIDDLVLGDFVIVVRVVGRILEPPLDLAVVGVERQHARGPFVVARAIFGIVIGTGIADALIDGLGLGIIGRSHPHRSAAVFPALLAVFPGLVAGLARARDGVGTPCLLAGVEIGRVDPAADAEFAAGRADDRAVANDERGERHSLAQGWLRHLALPKLFAGRPVERKDTAVQGNRDDFVLPQRDAAIIDAAARHIAGPGAVDPGIEFPLDLALLPARYIDCVDGAPAVRDVHHAVIDKGRSFKIALGIAAAGLQSAEADREGKAQPADRAGVDLLERREPMALVILVMQQPVLRLTVGAESALERHVGGTSAR